MENREYYESATGPSCDCSTTEYRLKAIAGGGKQLVKQCLRCGASSNSHKMSSLTPRQLAECRPFDNALRDAWEEKRTEYFRHRREYAFALGAAETREKDAEWWRNYNTYLQTLEWKAKRDRVIRRDPVCKGCGVNKSSHAHHLTYRHLHYEFLFELVGVCSECHERLHPRDEKMPVEDIRVLAFS